MLQLTSRQQEFILTLADATDGTIARRDLGSRIGLSDDGASEVMEELQRLGLVRYNSMAVIMEFRGREWVHTHKSQPLVVDLNEYQRGFLLAVSAAPDGRIIHPALGTVTGLAFGDADHLRKSLESLGLVHSDPFGVTLSASGRSAVERIRTQPPSQGKVVKVELVSPVSVDTGATMPGMEYRLSREEFAVLTYLHENAEAFDASSSFNLSDVAEATYLEQREANRAVSYLTALRLAGKFPPTDMVFAGEGVECVYLTGAGEQFMRALEDQLAAEIGEEQVKQGGTARKLTVKIGGFIYDTSKAVIVKVLRDYVTGKHP